MDEENLMVKLFYPAILEKEPGSVYGVTFPDLPGCVTCGDSIEEVQSLIQQAVAAHLESLRAHGEPVPEPTAKTFQVTAA